MAPHPLIVPFEQLDPTWQERIHSALACSRAPDFASPTSPEELSAVVSQAQAAGQAIMPCGQGSKLSWGQLVDPCQLVVSTQKLNRLVEHAAADLTVTVEAGIRLADLQVALAQAGQFLPVDPLYPDQATIGGILATADTGSWRHRYGGIRDLVLGITFVRADGQIAKAGGRVVKNVAGYDLMKLLSGSYGTLAILAQVTLRLYPLPEARHLLLAGGSWADLESLRRDLQRSALTPAAADLLSAKLTQAMVGIDLPSLAVEFHGLSEGVAAQAEQFRTMAQGLGLEMAALEPSPDRLSALSGSSPFFLAKIGSLPINACQVASTIAQHSPASLLRIHAGSGLGHWLAEGIHLADIHQIRSILAEKGGFLTVLAAPAEIKQNVDVWGSSDTTRELMWRVKRQFDPNDRLSPNRISVGGDTKVRNLTTI